MSILCCLYSEKFSLYFQKRTENAPPDIMRSRNAGDKTDYFNRVYEVVRKIPQGKVTTYGAIAEALGHKGGARLVGWALNSDRNVSVPAHRVVNRNGELTGKAWFGHPDAMRSSLEKEGVTFKGERVDMTLHFWKPGLRLKK